MSAHCETCGFDLAYDLSCSRCETRSELHDAKQRIEGLERALERVQQSEWSEHQRRSRWKAQARELQDALLQTADAIREALRKGGLRDAPEHAEAILKDADVEARRLARSTLSPPTQKENDG